MFGKKKKDEELIFDNDLVGCIGKLPIHMEFIKHRVNLPEIANLDQWYQNAYHYLSRQYGNEFKVIFGQMPLYHFSYISAERLPLLGTVIASQDQSGRAYPFIIFRLAEHPLAKEWPLLMPVLYEDFFSTSQRLCYSLRNGSLPELYQQVNLLNQTVTKISKRMALEKSLKSLQTITFGDLWNVISGTHKNLAVEFFVATTLQQLEIFKTQVLQNQFVGIRLPIIGNEKSAASSVIFWLELLNNFLPEVNQYLQIFWNASGECTAGNLLIYFKPMPTNCFGDFLLPATANDKLLDVWSAAENKNENCEKIGTVTIDFSASLLKTLQLWSKPGFL